MTYIKYMFIGQLRVEIRQTWSRKILDVIGAKKAILY